MLPVVKTPIETVKKVWGTEQILVNDDYCMKLLTLHPGFTSSLHYHRVKRETFIVKKGFCFLEIHKSSGESEVLTMNMGESFTIRPGVPHRFWVPSLSVKPCVIYEVSSHHEDNDTERLEPSKKLDDGW